jgi:threonine dehydrogenase-like Zn-dependent dehydrogenase
MPQHIKDKPATVATDASPLAADVFPGDAAECAETVGASPSGPRPMAAHTWPSIRSAGPKIRRYPSQRCAACVAGRLVLMGSMSVPLPTSYLDMFNNWEILGQFMYPRQSYSRLLDLVRSGRLDHTKIEPVIYPLDQVPEAMDKAAEIKNLQCVVIRYQ